MLAFMVCRFVWVVLAALSCLGLSGCYPTAEGTLSEEKNPYFLEGKARVAARDYRGAIAAFEKALEENSRSALAHFELGVLYEQHGEGENDYINAMFHYQQAMRLRPNAYPCDNARLRMASCKRELVKAESLAPVYQSMQRELERLRTENQQMRKLLENWQSLAGNRLPGAPPNSRPTQDQFAPPPNNPLPSTPPALNPGGPNPAATPTWTAGPANPQPRTYTVRPGDTLASIARQCRIKLETLQAANPGLNPRQLRAGQVLRVP